MVQQNSVHKAYLQAEETNDDGGACRFSLKLDQKLTLQVVIPILMWMKDAIYPMRAVVRQTGLTAHVIRAWERRYGAVVPHRTSSRRRLYSMADIERLKLLKRGVSVGNSIAQIAKMDTEALRALLSSESAARPRRIEPPATRSASPKVYIDETMEAILQLDASAMERALDAASVALPRFVMMNHVVLPILEKIGRWWADGRLKVVNEHVGSMVLRQFLGEALRTVDPEEGAPVIITTTPAGQWHEFGAMIAAVVAVDVGWRAIYCGPNLPAEEIAAAVHEKNASVVALSIVHPTDVHQLKKEIQRLLRLLSPQCRLVVGGQFARKLDGQFGTPSPTFVSDMQALQEFLQTLIVE